MFSDKLRATSHAIQRMAQRHIGIRDIELVLQYGRIEYRAGAEFCFLAARDIPSSMSRCLQRLIGTTVVIVKGSIATVYRNRAAISTIKRKLKRTSKFV